MKEKDNIISLEDRRREKEEKASLEREGVRPEGEQDREGVTAELGPLPGKLTWMNCPACGTLQYTEVFMTGGRVHDVCGNRVEEAVLDIDVRAEYTIAGINLERLQTLGELLNAETRRHEEYRERLANIAGSAPEPYPFTEENIKTLPIAEIGPLGMLISEALHDPSRYFKGEKPENEGESQPDSPPDSSSPSPPSPPKT